MNQVNRADQMPHQQPNYYHAQGSSGYSQGGGDDTVLMGEWIVSMLLLIIPLVNIFLVFYWAFSSSTKPSKANFFKAQLILTGVWIVIALALSAFS